MLMVSPIVTRRIVLGGGIAASSYLIATRQFNWWPFGGRKDGFQNAQNLNPPDDTGKNRIFLPVRYKEELQPILIQHRPLLLNFTIRGHESCNKLTGALQRIVSLETDKFINLVDIEADEPANQDLLLEYQVSELPTVVALKKQLIQGKYAAAELLEDPKAEVDWIKLKKWIESHADDE